MGRQLCVRRRRNDLETMRRAVPLLRSDYQATNDGAYGSPEYVVLSSLAPCYASSVTLSTVTDEDWAELRRMNELFLKIKDDLLYSDFYPLTPFSLDNDVWLAFQFDRPEAGSGAIQVFRRAEATSGSATLKLSGLNPGRRYTVEKLNGRGGRQTRTGQSLMQQGLTVSLPDPGSVAVFRYSRA